MDDIVLQIMTHKDQFCVIVSKQNTYILDLRNLIYIQNVKYNLDSIILRETSNDIKIKHNETLRQLGGLIQGLELNRINNSK